MNAPVAPLWEGEVFRPWDDPAKRHLRARIIRCQRMATQFIKSATCDQAHTQYWEALNLASRTAFAPSDEVRLNEVLRTLAAMFRIAKQFERWEGGNEDLGNN